MEAVRAKGVIVIPILIAALVRLLFMVGAGRCDALIAERNTGAGWQSATLYADRAYTPKRPRVAEADTAYQDSAFVSVTQSGVGTSLRCRCAGGAVSNVLAVVPAGSFPRDTTLYKITHDGPAAPMLGGGSHEARWVSLPSDTSFVRIITLDQEQLEFRDRHCTCCGYYWQRGVKILCR